MKKNIVDAANRLGETLEALHSYCDENPGEVGALHWYINDQLVTALRSLGFDPAPFEVTMFRRVSDGDGTDSPAGQAHAPRPETG